MISEAKNPLITLYGSNYIENDWTLPCMRSWRNILNISPSEFYVLPDKPLSRKERETFSAMDFQVLDANSRVEKFLANYPALDEIRVKDGTWRKIIDAAIIFAEVPKITIIDTDVFIKDKVFLPMEGFDIAYMREDVPAYRGKWNMAWREKMVPALNAGLVTVDPAIIDFDYLEKIVAKYLKNCKNYWWSEQSAWACLAGRTKKRALYSGQQVKVTSGMRKRTVVEIQKNGYKYFGKKGMIESYDEFRNLLDGGSIFHFAGPGKYMFKASYKDFKTSIQPDPVQIVTEPENTLSLSDKFFISMRLYLKEHF
ncbi:hypothetical protein [Autumnicola musiva]|uniref:Nucleotide-diphospho-sugar transferase domain-containing protein n=1 Tax=Autumnicola musiva TaxID=3075589 RepID=A0ABU3D2U2_9FLAO|nr:hypothetical protein [Zunongwangia sp. F117]MDT0675842.1 hypothetical protein [Zunongwangia sp. F117]